MTFEKLIEMLGAKLGVEFGDAGGAVAVETDGTIVILQDAGELLLLRAEVGEMPPDAKAAVLASAMEANFLYQGTGGATLAINPADGKLHIHKYNWMERLDVDAVIDAIDKLSDTTAAWRRILSDCRSGASSGDAPTLGELDDRRMRLGEGDFMKV